MKDWVKQINHLGTEKIPFAFFINFDGSYGEVYPVDELKDNNIFINFPSIKPTLNPIPKSKIEFSSNPIDFNSYKKAFDTVQFHLHRGDSYLTNLTFATPIEISADLSEIYKSVQAKYRILFKDDWVCFSPETFIQIKENSITTFPMKGTIDARTPDARKILKTDLKEVAEHHTVVDLLRNDLSHIAKNVQVKRLMYVEEIRTQGGNILQMSSEIEGELESDWNKNLGNILNTILPAGSISGAPKDKTVEIIKSAETLERGFYTGVAGVFDGESVDSCVLIRFIQRTKNGYYYKSGGGITALSNLEDEYKELNQKIYVPIY